MKRGKHPEALPTIGWREWVAIPSLGVPFIKAKIDTGARTSSLHAFDVEVFDRRGKTRVRFSVHPLQRDSRTVVLAEAEVIDERYVRSSSGHRALRPVISTEVLILGRKVDTEITLANRDDMGFRMLLGREAVRGRYLVDAGHSFLGGKPTKKELHK